MAVVIKKHGNLRLNQVLTMKMFLFFRLLQIQWRDCASDQGENRT